MTYLTAVKKPGRPDYVVFRGEVGSGGSVDAFLAASRDLNLPAGSIRGRVQMGELTRSIPDVAGGRAQRPNATLEFFNHDDALDPLLVGTTSSDPTEEYTENSLLSLRGKIFHGVIDEDGTAYEAALSPTLRRSGPITVRESKRSVVVPLSFDDDGILGRSIYAVTLDALKKSKSTDGVTALGDGEIVDVYGAAAPFTQAEADDELGEWDENFDTQAHFLYSMKEVPLVRVAPRLKTFDGFRQFFAFVSLMDPVISGTAWTRAAARDSAASPASKGRIYKIERWVRCADGALHRLWIVVVCLSSNLSDEQRYLVPGTDRYGISFDGLDQHTSASHVLRSMIIQHARLGAAAIHEGSFTAARKALPTRGAVGGLYTGDTPLADIAFHYGQATGFCMWPGLDDKLRLLPNQAYPFVTPDLPVLGPSDVFDAIEEEIPGGVDQRGAPVTRATIDWTSEQRAFWGDQLVPRVPGSTEVDLGQEVEARISGAVVYPPKAHALLAGYGSSRAYVARRIRFTTHLWVASYELGSLFRLTHPQGLEVAAAGGYQGRLIRLLSVTPAVPRRRCMATFEDLGSVESFLVGVVDDIDQWVRRKPVGVNLELTAASAIVETDADFFVAGDVGMTLVTRGAAFESNRGPNRKVVSVDGPRQVTVNFAYPDTEVIASSPDPTGTLDHNWILMKNHSTEGASFRPTRIRGGKESTGRFLNNDPSYRYFQRE